MRVFKAANPKFLLGVMDGGSLERRVLRLMHRRMPWARHWRVISAMACVTVMGTTGLVAGMVGVRPSSAQILESYIPAATFDVAAIRQNLSDEHARSHIYNSPESSTFNAVNFPLKWLLQYAFDMPDTRILGGPGALLSERFDIEAKPSPAVDATIAKLPQPQRRQEKLHMLQALLSERFKLAMHPETRELPIYTLTVAKNGPTLKSAKGAGTKFDESNARIVDYGATTSLLAEQLARILGRPVVDKTGLDQRFDIDLNWTPANAPASGDMPPSIFTAIQEQLGLKLDTGKGPVAVLVIDHIEPPTEN